MYSLQATYINHKIIPVKFHFVITLYVSCIVTYYSSLLRKTSKCASVKNLIPPPNRYNFLDEPKTVLHQFTVFRPVFRLQNCTVSFGTHFSQKILEKERYFSSKFPLKLHALLSCRFIHDISIHMYLVVNHCIICLVIFVYHNVLLYFWFFPDNDFLYHC